MPKGAVKQDAVWHFDRVAQITVWHHEDKCRSAPMLHRIADSHCIEFKPSARDDSEEIGNDTYERMVVDLVRLDQHLKAKAPR
jgi:hypothetical protein